MDVLEGRLSSWGSSTSLDYYLQMETSHGWCTIAGANDLYVLYGAREAFTKDRWYTGELRVIRYGYQVMTDQEIAERNAQENRKD